MNAHIPLTYQLLLYHALVAGVQPILRFLQNAHTEEIEAVHGSVSDEEPFEWVILSHGPIQALEKDGKTVYTSSFRNRAHNFSHTTSLDRKKRWCRLQSVSSVTIWEAHIGHVVAS